MLLSFKEFLNAAAVKPQTTLLKKRLNKESGLKVSTDMREPTKPVQVHLKHAIKASPISSALRKQRLTNPKNRFKVRKGSNLDSTSSSKI